MGRTVTELASFGYGRGLNAPHAKILDRAMWSFLVRREIRRTRRVAIAELQEGVVAHLDHQRQSIRDA
jgi:hypothetical protein